MDIAVVTPVLDHELEARHRAQPVDRRRTVDLDPCLIHRRLPLSLQPRCDRVGRGLVSPAFRKPIEHDVDGAPVRGIAAEHHRLPGHRHGMRNPRLIERPPLECLYYPRRPLHTGAVRKGDVGNQVAFVLLRDKSHGNLPKHQGCEAEQTGEYQQDRRGQPERPSHDSCVGPGHARECRIKAAEEPAEGESQRPIDDVRRGSLRLQQDRRQRRAERQRIDR